MYTFKARTCFKQSTSLKDTKKVRVEVEVELNLVTLLFYPGTSSGK